jgi:hypothetical protein
VRALGAGAGQVEEEGDGAPTCRCVSADLLPLGADHPGRLGGLEGTDSADVGQRHTDATQPDVGLLTIGAYATAARLTPKALRLYDELGVFATRPRSAGRGRANAHGALERGRQQPIEPCAS